jgi:hypothetical protein
MSDEYEQASDAEITRPPDPDDEEQTARESAMGDPREEPGTAPEGRHPGAEDLPQGDPRPE